MKFRTILSVIVLVAAIGSAYATNRASRQIYVKSFGVCRLIACARVDSERLGLCPEPGIKFIDNRCTIVFNLPTFRVTNA